jgi:RRXRR protein
MMIYVKSKHGKALMPCSERKARVLLKGGKAKIVNHQPFIIELVYGSSGYKQPISLGIDSGYSYIGFSAITDKKELFGGELTLLENMSERLSARRIYRRTRRNHIRYRKPSFLKDTKTEGWLAPSIKHKLDTHIRFINHIKNILPITSTIIEVANFDIQKINNPEITGKEYQNGEQKGFSDLREYVLHRDKHQCQNLKCKGKSKVLQVHHLGYYNSDRSNRPGNLITLCTHCHTPENHQKNGFLYGWKPKLKGFRQATFMSMVRWRLVNKLGIGYTYGTETKFKRKQLKLGKSHHNDAFVIADGTTQRRYQSIYIFQKRKNNRTLEKFYDAKYIDLRDGKKKYGKELCSKRTKRNRQNLSESLRSFRAHQISKGRKNIRKQRYKVQPQDIVLYQSKKYKALGIQNKGAYLKMTDGVKPVVKSMKKIKVVFHQKTFVYK